MSTLFNFAFNNRYTITSVAHIPGIPSYFCVPGALPPRPQETYKEEEARIQAVVEELNALTPEERKAIKISHVAEFYSLRYNRLLERLKGRPSKLGLVPINRKLTEEQDRALCQHLTKLDSIGTSPLIPDIAFYANAILQQEHNDPDTPAPVVGENWVRRWLARHPEYSIVRQYAIDSDRKAAQTPDEIQRWMDHYEAICKKYSIAIEDRWNGDETGFRVGIGKHQYVITLNPGQRPTLGSANCRESVTVVECVSAGGFAIPPFVILPGTRHMESWYKKTLLGLDYIIGVSETGYINAILAFQWIQHVEYHTRRYQKVQGGYRLLLVDGHTSHLTKEVVEYCEQHKIILFILPSHSTHLLQPLDVAVFQPYKHYHSKVSFPIILFLMCVI